MNNEQHLSPQERNIKLLVQVNAYLSKLGRDPVQIGGQVISNAVLERQLAELQAEYRASKS